MIDNYDSFTYNVVQYLGELGEEDVRVVRNDVMKVDDLVALEPEMVVISPGPCTPNEAGVSMALIEAVGGDVPVLGICLGHQCIGQVYGGEIVRARRVMHGKTSQIFHGGEGVLAGLANPFEATRYHSLVIDRECLPDCLEVTAWTQTDDGDLDEIMGVRHLDMPHDGPVEGVQFHPESILTSCGHDLLRNFLRG